jgi:hypothetical protein
MAFDSGQRRCNKWSEREHWVQEVTYQSPLPRPSPLALRGSRLEPWPAAADAKLDGMCEGILIAGLLDAATEDS